MRKENNILNEFFLGEEEREVRATFGKYHVYEANAEFYEIIRKVGNKSNKNDEETIDGIHLNREETIPFLVKMMKAVTDLPESIANEDILRKMESLKRKPNKLLRNIEQELYEMMLECFKDSFKLDKQQYDITKNMSPKVRKAYEELKAKQQSKIKESNKPELTEEELELQKAQEKLAQCQAVIDAKKNKK